MKIWKKILGFNDYEISNDGDLRSYKHGKQTILKKRYSKDGYVWYILTENGKSYCRRAHRLVAEAFIDNPENKETVNHIDGNKMNNNVNNLEWATRNEQMQHAYKHGLKKPVRGCLQGNHVLSEKDVIEIRSIYIARDKQFGMRALARKYNVSEPTIDKCVRYKSYLNV